MGFNYFWLNGYWICYDRSIEGYVMRHQYDICEAMRKAGIQGVSTASSEELEKILKGGFQK